MKKWVLLLFLLLSSLLYAKEEYNLFFQGNSAIDTRTLYKVLNLHKPYFYEFYKKSPKINLKVLPLAIDTLEEFYKSKGFYHTKITSKKENKKIILKIQENRPIIIKKIKIVSKLPIKQAIGLKIGTIFDADKFTKSKKRVKLIYKNHGYANATFTIKAYIDIIKNSAKIIYKIRANKLCRFTNITIKSPKNIEKKLIKSLLAFHKGDIYSFSLIKQTYKNIYAYDAISQVTMKTTLYNNKDVNVTVHIKENQKPILFQIGVGASSDEGATTSLGIKHRNFYGNLKTLALKTRVTQIKQSVKLSFTMPLPQKNSFGSELNFENENFFGFKESHILLKGYFSQNNRLFKWLQEALIIDTSHSYDSKDTLLFPQKSLFLLSPKISWKYDTRDNILNPSKGFLLEAQLQGSILNKFSDASYYKAILTGAYILPLYTNRIATKVEIGSLHTYSGNVPNSYRFFAGGMNSNRAYGYRLLGPRDKENNPVGFNSIINTTIEERFPIYHNFHGVVFNDNTFIGATYSPSHTVGYYSGGFGIRYETPIGPIAIDLGFSLDKPLQQHALHFHIGELF